MNQSPKSDTDRTGPKASGKKGLSYRCRGLRLELDEPVAALETRLQKLLGTSDFSYEIERESLDARRRGGRQDLHFEYTVNLHFAEPRAAKKAAERLNLQALEDESLTAVPGPKPLPKGVRPVVAGMGPSGLFAAYLLAREGYRPIVLERGDAVEERRKRVEAFRRGEAPLDPESNVQFGEGGAGTFSDGKLTSRSKDPLTKQVREILCAHGAPEEIRYSFQPHIGTDLLEKVVRDMRETMRSWGADIRFRTALTGIEIGRGGELLSFEAGGQRFRGPLFLGIGHSARDTFRMLIRAGLRAEPKDFAVGFRIEHEQAWLDRRQYGEAAGHPRLGAASYQVSSPFYEGRNAYSFCMCPGGEVIAAASEPGRLVVNGMSYHARSGPLANSAILTSVKAGRDFGTELTDGLRFQEIQEALAFEAGGRNMHAPVMTVGNYLRGQGFEPAPAAGMPYPPTYTPGIKLTNFDTLYSPEILRALARGIKAIDGRMPGFAAADAWLTGAETRSSSPLRFVRDRESREALGCAGLYPIGEGAGYAGGIVSAALDGLRSALAFISRYAALN